MGFYPTFQKVCTHTKLPPLQQKMVELTASETAQLRAMYPGSTIIRVAWKNFQGGDKEVIVRPAGSYIGQEKAVILTKVGEAVPYGGYYSEAEVRESQFRRYELEPKRQEEIKAGTLQPGTKDYYAGVTLLGNVRPPTVETKEVIVKKEYVPKEVTVSPVKEQKVPKYILDQTSDYGTTPKPLPTKPAMFSFQPARLKVSEWETKLFAPVEEMKPRGEVRGRLAEKAATEKKDLLSGFKFTQYQKKAEAEYAADEKAYVEGRLKSLERATTKEEAELISKALESEGFIITRTPGEEGSITYQAEFKGFEKGKLPPALKEYEKTYKPTTSQKVFPTIVSTAIQTIGKTPFLAAKGFLYAAEPVETTKKIGSFLKSDITLPSKSDFKQMALSPATAPFKLVAGTLASSKTLKETVGGSITYAKSEPIIFATEVGTGVATWYLLGKGIEKVGKADVAKKAEFRVNLKTSSELKNVNSNVFGKVKGKGTLEMYTPAVKIKPKDLIKSFEKKPTLKLDVKSIEKSKPTYDEFLKTKNPQVSVYKTNWGTEIEMPSRFASRIQKPSPQRIQFAYSTYAPGEVTNKLTVIGLKEPSKFQTSMGIIKQKLTSLKPTLKTTKEFILKERTIIPEKVLVRRQLKVKAQVTASTTEPKVRIQTPEMAEFEKSLGKQNKYYSNIQVAGKAGSKPFTDVLKGVSSESKGFTYSTKTGQQFITDIAYSKTRKIPPKINVVYDKEGGVFKFKTPEPIEYMQYGKATLQSGRKYGFLQVSESTSILQKPKLPEITATQIGSGTIKKYKPILDVSFRNKPTGVFAEDFIKKSKTKTPLILGKPKVIEIKRLTPADLGLGSFPERKSIPRVTPEEAARTLQIQREKTFELMAKSKGTQLKAYKPKLIYSFDYSQPAQEIKTAYVNLPLKENLGYAGIATQSFKTEYKPQYKFSTRTILREEEEEKEQIIDKVLIKPIIKTKSKEKIGTETIGKFKPIITTSQKVGTEIIEKPGIIEDFITTPPPPTIGGGSFTNIGGIKIPKPFDIPPLKGLPDYPTYGFKEKTKFKTKFTPTLVGISKGFKSYKPAKQFTGLEIRQPVKFKTKKGKLFKF